MSTRDSAAGRPAAKKTVRVSTVKELADGICELVLTYPERERPENAVPGQFVMIYPGDGSHILGRPISVCGYNPVEGALRLVFRVVGKGTGELAALKAGEEADVLGLLGNGYPMEELRTRKSEGATIALVGGGIGIPPMLELARQLPGCRAVLGYRTDDLFLMDEFQEYAVTQAATEDGSFGTKGTVLDVLRQGAAPDILCACGPLPMLRALKEYAAENGVTAFLSLEERMACGVGVCLGCVCRTTYKDAHSQVNRARVCTEGPVFRAEDVEL